MAGGCPAGLGGINEVRTLTDRETSAAPRHSLNAVLAQGAAPAQGRRRFAVPVVGREILLVFPVAMRMTLTALPTICPYRDYVEAAALMG